MNWKPNEMDIVDYLYDGLSADKRKQFEEYLQQNNDYTYKAINKISKKIVAEYKPEKIYLFSFFAWGEPDFDSDVDFFIVKNTKKLLLLT